MENTINNEIFDNNGNVNISDEVISVIASLAASGIKGVAGMAGGAIGGFAELIGKKNPSKGVKVVKEDDKLTIDLAIIVEYGAKIPDVAWELQDKVKNEVESMTGLSVATVNVSVDGVNVPITDDAAKEPEKADAAKATDGE